jgi:hypothetical protein
MTLNDVPAVRDTFAGFKMTRARVTYSLAKAGTKTAGELIIAGARKGG